MSTPFEWAILSMCCGALALVAIDIAFEMPAVRTDANRLGRQGSIDAESLPPRLASQPAPAATATGFLDLTNGFTEQGPPVASANERRGVVRSFNHDRFIFD